MCLSFVFVVALVGFVFPLAQEGAICSDQLDTWSTRTSGTTKTLYGVTYGNGMFVAVGGDVLGNGGTIILTSADGITWTERTSGFSKYLYNVTYGNGTFVATGTSGTILSSTDGVSWTQRTSGTTYGLSGLTYGNGTFAAVGWYGTILTSTDGVTWSTRISGTTQGLHGVTYGNGTFVAVGWYGTILTSTDGVTWTERTSGYLYILEGVAYCDGTFIAVGTFGTILTSPDGVTWNTRTSGTSSDLVGVTYGDGTFVAVTPGTRTTLTSGYINVSRGEEILLTSADGTTWTKRNFSSLYGVTYGNSTFVAVGGSGSILQSDPLIDQYTLTVTKTGTGGGTVTSNPAGINCGADCSEEYDEGTSVTLTPTPGSGSTFTGWSGACSGAGACTVSMTSDKTVTATFTQQQQQQYTLTVTKSGTGSGTVTSNPAGINCGSDCSETYSKVQKVKLTAKADANSTFTGWSGGGCSGKGTCTVTVNTQITVTATFDVKRPDISVSPSSLDFGIVKVNNKVTRTLKIANNGTGDLAITISGIEGTDFSLQSSSNVKIKPQKVYTLKVIFKPTSPGSKTTTLGLSSNDPDTPELNVGLSGSTVEQPQQYTLTVTKAGTGSGTVTSNPAGINCGADCSEAYNQGTSVTLTATQDSGSTFTGWSGACSGAGACTVSMTSDKTVTATFTQQQQEQYTLTVTKSGTGSGTVTSNPAGINCGADCSEAYNQGTSVTLTATQDSGSTFTGWSGACSGTGACIINMTSDKAVTAAFAQQQYTLTVTKAGTGSGTVTGNPAGINCGADCSETYNQGTSVTLLPTPDSGSTFTGWSGACSGAGPCTVTMTSDKTATAAFAVSYDGTWNGTTSQGKESSLTVSNNGIASFKWGISCAFVDMSSTTTFSPPRQITGNTFSVGGIMVGIWDGHINQMHTVTINGTFNSPTSASGNLGISGSVCSTSVTWSATK